MKLYISARCEGQTRRMGRQRGRLRRNRAAHRAALPTLPPARRGQFGNGGLAGQSHGRAHVSRLQRRARCGRRVCCSPSMARRIYDFGQLNFDELHAFLSTIKTTGRGAEAGRQVVKEIRGRLDSARHRAGLSEFQSSFRNAFRRRIAAHPAFNADRLRTDGHALCPGRAQHRPAS